MATNERITEAEAVATAGVSARTLQRFQESGYLEVANSPEGTKSYLRSQIIEIFGAADALSAPAQGAEETQCSFASQADEDEPPACFGIPPEFTRTPSTEHSPLDEQGSSPDLHEIQRLRNLVALQERILDMKEAEVTDLRSQRDWLKSRIERLEEKAERDQILLLSETQTIRKLVSLNEGRRSAFHNILEWLGIAKQPEVRALSAPDRYSNSDTVELKGAANG